MHDGMTAGIKLQLDYLSATVGLCEKERNELNAELVRWRLQHGPFAGDSDNPSTESALPLDVAAFTAMTWLRATRAVPSDEEHGNPLADALSAIHMLGAPAAVVITPGARGGMHLGVSTREEHQRDSLDWLRSVLAPGCLFAPCQPPRELVSSRRWLSNGVTYAMSPARDEPATRSTVPGLARLLLAPGEDWVVALRLDPLNSYQTRDANAELAKLARGIARFGTITDATNQLFTVSRERPEVKAVMERVVGMLAHVEAAQTVGLWNVTVHVSALEEPALEMMTGAVGSLLKVDPLAGNRWSALRRPVEDPVDGKPRHTPSTLLSTEDVAQFLDPGTSSLPGLEVAAAPPGGRRPQPCPQPLRLGTFAGTSTPVTLDVQDLEGHAFVTGTTGMGKSTTVQRLLLDLANVHDIPFLIVDPVKADYEELAPHLTKGLRVVDAVDLRLNVLLPYPDFSTRTHLELVANAFKGSFSMPSPTPYIVAQLFERMIARSHIEPPPTLHDMRDLLDPYVASLGYDGEISSNIRASLGLRLNLLLSPPKAERVANPTGDAVRELFTRPTVVQLSTLGDDEERSFLMSMLTLYVAERARVRGRSGGKVRHVTVLEEAHRILPEPQASTSSEEGDAASVSARLLTQMLAEIRSYGEAVIVVDQSPAAVARDVVRNTNLKIAHRLPEPEDRDVVGGSMSVDEEQLPSLSRLQRGQALVATRRTPEPQTVTVAAPPAAWDEDDVPAPPADVAGEDPRLCCRGRWLQVHHAAEALSAEAEDAVVLPMAALQWATGPLDDVWPALDRQLKVIIGSDVTLSQEPDDAARCLLYVGLRRALVRHVQFGHLRPELVGATLRRMFTACASRRGRVSALPRGDAAELAPFPGCRWCSHICRFRHVGEASTTMGVAAVRKALGNLWQTKAGGDTVSKLQAWMHAVAADLEEEFGADQSTDMARCGVVQYAAASGMPVAVQRRTFAPPKG